MATQAKNPFDVFDDGIDKPINPFDSIDPSASLASPTAMPEEQFNQEIMARIADPKQSVASIMDWAETTALRKISTPNAFRQNVELIRSGKTKKLPIVHGGPATEDEPAEVKVETPAIKPGSKLGTLARQTMGGLLLDAGEEAEAALSATFEAPFSDDTWETLYRRAWDVNDAQTRGDFLYNPGTAWTGYGGGTIASAFIPGLNVAKGGNMMVKGAKLAGLGAAETGFSTMMQNTPDNRLENVPMGAAVGAIAGPVLAPVVDLGAFAAKGAANKLGITDALDAGAAKVNDWARRLGLPQMWDRIPAEIKALAAKIKPTADDIHRMQEASQAFRRAGVDPRAVDVMSRSEQDVVGAAIRADQGAGRDEAYRQAGETASTLGQRLRQQFERVTNVRGNARQMGERIAESRDANATRAMDAMRANPIELSNDIVDVLSTDLGRTALRMVTRSADPATRDSVRAIPDLVRQLAPLSSRAREQILRQQPHAFTVGVADRLRIALNDMAEAATRAGRGGEARDIRAMRDKVRQAAGTTDPNYRDYLSKYAEDSRSLEAIETGRAAFDRNTDEFVEEATALSDDANTILRTPGAPAHHQYEIVRDAADPYGGRTHNMRIEQTLPDGSRVIYDIDMQRGQSVAGVSVHSYGPNGEYHNYGDSSAFNKYGQEPINDAMAYFRDNISPRFPSIEGVTGHRVGGVRQAARAGREQARDQFERTYMDAVNTEAARAAGLRADYTAVDDMHRLYQTEQRNNPDLTPEQFIASQTQRHIDDPNDSTFFRRTSPSQMFQRRVGAQPDDTVDMVIDSLGVANARNLTPEEMRRHLADAFPDEVNSPGFNEFADDVQRRVVREANRRDIPETTPEMDLPQDAPLAVGPEYRYVDDFGAGTNDPAFAPNPNPNYRPQSVAPTTSSGEYSASRAPHAQVGFEGYTPEAGRAYEQANDVNAESTAQELYDMNNGEPLSYDDIASMLDEVNFNDPGAHDFISLVTGAYNRIDPNVPRSRGTANDFGDVIEDDFEDLADDGLAIDDDDVPSLMDTQQEGLTANGLTYDELRADYEQALRFYEEDDVRPSFEQWVRDAFYEEEIPQSMWERIRGAAGRLAGDQSGSKPVPRVALPNFSRPSAFAEDAGPAPLRSATTEPPGAGIRRNEEGVPRYVNRAPEWIDRRTESYHPIRRGEVYAPSDRQLAVSEMGREMERRMGDSARGPFEMGRRLSSLPEQRARNEALLGRETEAALQRAADATMRQAETTARLNPGAGSQTALRQQDDAALAEMMSFFSNAMTGGKTGALQAVMKFFQGAGMTPQQTERLILRTLDPNQTDQVITELAQLVGGRDNAAQIVAMLRQASARGVGGALSVEPE